MVRILSFDIGILHLGWCLVEYDLLSWTPACSFRSPSRSSPSSSLSISDLSSSPSRYRHQSQTHTPTPTQDRDSEEQSCLDCLHDMRERMNIRWMDLYEGSSPYGMEAVRSLYHYLRTHDFLWSQGIDIIMIEKQMTSPRGVNIQALKMAQHIICFFLLSYPSIQQFVEYPAMWKSKHLFQVRHSSYAQRKR